MILVKSLWKVAAQYCICHGLQKFIQDRDLVRISRSWMPIILIVKNQKAALILTINHINKLVFSRLNLRVCFDVSWWCIRPFKKVRLQISQDGLLLSISCLADGTVFHYRKQCHLLVNCMQYTTKLLPTLQFTISLSLIVTLCQKWYGAKIQKHSLIL